MSIQLYTKEQLYLLQQLNPYLGKKKIPIEVMKKIESLLEMRGDIENHCIIIVLDKIYGYVFELNQYMNVLPENLDWTEDIESISIISKKRKKLKEWYLSSIFDKQGNKKFYILYTLKKIRWKENRNDV